MTVHATIHDATNARRDQFAERQQFHPAEYVG
jgi:hypothetical protein